mmetsp:Transcript_20803/g.19837  ORF Transcript_20803/g.19837 Transcript_20803/m.19837 type:complete len:239 (-) Transcript_20803:241-957(-)
MVLIMMLYPTITSYTFGIFNCVTIEEVSYLVRDFNVVCYSDSHIKSILVFGLPSLFIWVIGFPVGLYIMLYRRKSKLTEKDTIKRYGIYYIGLTDERFYWQLAVINMKRVIYIIFQVTLLEYNSKLFVLTLFMIMYIYMISVKYYSPYYSVNLNRLDIFSTLTTSLTLIFAMFYLETSEESRVSENILSAIFIILIILNCVYLIYWCKSMAAALFTKFKYFVGYVKTMKSKSTMNFPK